MKFVSTQNDQIQVSLSQAISQGLASGGGLFVPRLFPQYNLKEFLDDDNLTDIAIKFLKPFFRDDPLISNLVEICENTFSFQIPLNFVSDNLAILELFHGPTGAFKDVGARFLAQCFNYLKGRQTILVATSGDTGSAVGSAFHNLASIDVFILYPADKISDFQERQLKFWGNNVKALRVRGDFDDCQNMVKSAFKSPMIKKKYNLSSANSINIGRLLPQCIYYVYASLQYYKLTNSRPNFSIPTGNMGNALAAIWVKHMGFPIGRILLTCNENDTIPKYFEDKKFTPKSSVQTLANAMDVGNPSNMERYLHLVNQKSEIEEDISAISISDKEIKLGIQLAYKEWKRLVCPHTATAVKNYFDMPQLDTIIVATAHPFKFKKIVEDVIGEIISIPENLAKFQEEEKEAIEIENTISDLVDILENRL